MDIGKNLQLSIDVYLKNFVVLFVASLLTGILSCVTFLILAGPLSAGLFVILRKVLRGEPAEIGEIFNHFDKFGVTFVFTLLIVIITIVAGIITIIPFLGKLALLIVVYPLLTFAYFIGIGLIVEQNQQPTVMLANIVSYITADFVQIWIYALVHFILGAIPVLAIFSNPLMSLGLIQAYDELTNQTPTTPGVSA